MLRDIRNQKFFFLTVISENGRTKGREAKWLCLCDCGNYTTVRLSNLTNHRIKSCGCKQKELQSTSNIEHGGVRLGQTTPEYRAWMAMKSRCYNKDSINYPNYGGRGITICDRWINCYANFLEDMGPKPSNTSIDRVDNDGHYCPENCRWAERPDQDNKKTTTYYVEYAGRKHSLSEWAKEFDLNIYTLRYRLENGWSVHDALHTKPNDKYHYHTRTRK